MSRRNNADNIRDIVRGLIEQEFGRRSIRAEGSFQVGKQRSRRDRGADHVQPRGGSRGRGQGRRPFVFLKSGDNMIYEE